MKKIVLLLVFAVFSTSFGFAQNKNTSSKFKTQTTQEPVFYVDVRTPAEFAQGSIKNAVNIPLSQIENQLNQFKGKKRIVVFCRSGARSANAKSILEKNGITNVTNGGTWQNVASMLKKE